MLIPQLLTVFGVGVEVLQTNPDVAGTVDGRVCLSALLGKVDNYREVLYLLRSGNSDSGHYSLVVFEQSRLYNELQQNTTESSQYRSEQLFRFLKATDCPSFEYKSLDMFNALSDSLTIQCHFQEIENEVPMVIENEVPMVSFTELASSSESSPRNESITTLVTEYVEANPTTRSGVRAAAENVDPQLQSRDNAPVGTSFAPPRLESFVQPKPNASNAADYVRDDAVLQKQAFDNAGVKTKTSTVKKQFEQDL